MKIRLYSTFGLIVLVTLAFATSCTCGPYYAMPSWDQKLACDTRTNCPRFLVLSNWNNDAVLDKETGLVWEKSPRIANTAWFDAQRLCNILKIGNRMGWRLPTIQESMSLMDPSVPPSGPTLPAGHPFSNVAGELYWSATTTADDSSFALVANFSNANITAYTKNTALRWWCVRGGQGVDPQ